MNIKNSLVEIAGRHSLRERALKNVEKLLDIIINDEETDVTTLLNNHEKSQILFEFHSVSFQMDKHDNFKIVTRLDIYSKLLVDEECDISVGYYEEWVDLNGEHLDEFLIFDWTDFNLLNN